MEYYNYLISEINDVIAYIKDELNIKDIIKQNKSNPERTRENLYDQLFCEDAITGNASKSYTMNSTTAEEYLVTNWGLLKEAVNELSPNFDPIEAGAEACDVLIRCYLLDEAIDLALKRLL